MSAVGIFLLKGDSQLIIIISWLDYLDYIKLFKNDPRNGVFNKWTQSVDHCKLVFKHDCHLRNIICCASSWLLYDFTRSKISPPHPPTHTHTIIIWSLCLWKLCNVRYFFFGYADIIFCFALVLLFGQVDVSLPTQPVNKLGMWCFTDASLLHGLGHILHAVYYLSVHEIILY